MTTIKPLPPKLEAYLDKRFGKDNWKFIGFDDNYAQIQTGRDVISYNIEHYLP